MVVDVDGTRQSARQRALPQMESLPPAHRRFDAVCAPGYLGRKRGEVVRTRTVILQAHTHQFLGTFGGPGNGDYRGELVRATQVITRYARHPGAFSCFREARVSMVTTRDAAPLLDVLTAGLGVIARSRDYSLLDLEIVKQALARAPDQVCTYPESGMTRALYDCESISLTLTGPQVRLVVATHAATSSPPKIGVERDGMVYELFVSTLPSPAFTSSDALDLYLHRGSFETVLADEDVEQNRYNMVLPNGLVLRLREAFQAQRLPRNLMGRCVAQRTVRCIRHPRRPERDGSLRVLYAARIGHCRSCPLRAKSQESSATIKPRRVSAVLWPLSSPLSTSSPTPTNVPAPLPLAPVLWKDWSRCGIRRGWLKVIRNETVRLTSGPQPEPSPLTTPAENVLTRPRRLSWEQRVIRNARSSNAPRLCVTLHGLPATFARSFGFDLLATA